MEGRGSGLLAEGGVGHMGEREGSRGGGANDEGGITLMAIMGIFFSDFIDQTFVEYPFTCFINLYGEETNFMN